MRDKLKRKKQRMRLRSQTRAARETSAPRGNGQDSVDPLPPASQIGSDFVSLQDSSDGDEEAEDGKDAAEAVAVAGEDKFYRRMTSQVGRIFHAHKRQRLNEGAERPKQEDRARGHSLRKGASGHPDGPAVDTLFARMGQTWQPWIRDAYSGIDAHRRREAVYLLHLELAAYERYILPTVEEAAVTSFVVDRIRKCVVSLYPQASVKPFGSCATGLYLPTSDIDLVVLDERAASELHRLAKHLRNNDIAVPNSLQVIAGARVPIIKFKERLTNIDVDLSFNRTNGLDAVSFIRDVLDTHKATRPLVLAVKHFLSMRGLNEVFLGGLGSYAITCMVASFLQLHPQLQSGAMKEEENLGVLLIEFFELYGCRFDYYRVAISVVDGGKYFVKQINPRQPYLLSIADPGDATNDITRGSRNMPRVKATLENAYDLLIARVLQVKKDVDRGIIRFVPGRRMPHLSILGSILYIHPDMANRRARLEQVYREQDLAAADTGSNGTGFVVDTAPAIANGIITTAAAAKPPRAKAPSADYFVSDSE